jgi:hypothetical protein
LGTAHAITGIAANSAAKTKTPTLFISFNDTSLAAARS